MGFMAGFGAAFSESFNQASRERAVAEQDDFRTVYDDYANQRDQRQELEREDAKNVRLAKTLTEAHGHPPEAWTMAHEMLRGGATPSMVDDYLKSNLLIVGPKTTSGGPAVAGQAQEKPQGASAQMGAGAMSSPAPMGQPQQPQEEPTTSGFSNLLGGLFDGEKKRRSKRENAIARVADAIGQDLESVKQVLEGKDYAAEPLAGREDYQITAKPRSESSPDKVSNLNEAMTFQALAREEAERTGDTKLLETADALVEAQRASVTIQAQAKAEAEGLSYKPQSVVITAADGTKSYAPAIKNDEGQWVNAVDGKVIEVGGNVASVTGMTKRQEEQMNEIYDETGKVVGPYIERTLALKGMVRDSKDMQAIAEQFPGALTASGQVAQWVDRLGRNITTIVDLFTDPATGTTSFDTQDSIIDKAFKGGEGAEDDGMNFTADGINALQDVEMRMQEMVGGRIQDEAIATALLESKALRMTYAWAATQNQKGRAVSNDEFNKIYKAVLANGNPTAMVMEHKNFIGDQVENLRSERALMEEHNYRVRVFEKTHGFKPNAVVPTIDEILDEETAAEVLGIVSGGAPEDATPQAQGNLQPIGKTPDDRIIYKNVKTGETGTLE